jgi:hypothetical protein
VRSIDNKDEEIERDKRLEIKGFPALGFQQ